MNLTTSSGLALEVKDLEFQFSSAFLGEAYCVGFGSLVIAGKLCVNSLFELSEIANAYLFLEIQQALDAQAKKLGDEWQADQLEERAAYRQLCHA